MMRKKLFLLSLMITPVALFAQTGGKIKLFTGDCRDNPSSPLDGPRLINVFKLPENTLFKKIEPMEYNKWPLELENVPTGEYSFEFRNFYGQPVAKRVTVVEKQLIKVYLCPDSLDIYPQNSLSQLTNNDSILIKFSSFGCFHHSNAAISIHRINDTLMARAYLGHSYTVGSGRKSVTEYRYEPIRSTILGDVQLHAFRRFENELKFAKDGGCTTTDRYEMKSKYLSLSRTDGSCDWNGFYHLLTSFFGNLELLY